MQRQIEFHLRPNVSTHHCWSVSIKDVLMSQRCSLCSRDVIYSTCIAYTRAYLTDLKVDRLENVFNKMQVGKRVIMILNFCLSVC